MFRHHLAGISRIALDIRRADVEAQTTLQRARARNAFLQNLHAHAQVGDGVERGQCATEYLVLVAVDLCHDLHQALGTHRTLGKGIEARFDRHDGQDQGRVELGSTANLVRFGDQRAQRLRCDAVFFAQPECNARLLFWQVLGVGCGCAVDRLDLRLGRGVLRFVGRNGCGLARLQPAHQLGFPEFADFGPGHQGHGGKHDNESEHGKTAMRDKEQPLCNIRCKGSQSICKFIRRRHDDPFFEGLRRWHLSSGANEQARLNWYAFSMSLV